MIRTNRMLALFLFPLIAVACDVNESHHTADTGVRPALPAAALPLTLAGPSGDAPRPEVQADAAQRLQGAVHPSEYASCDLYDQDCPTGQKCAPYASEGGYYDAMRCVPVQGEAVPGDTCHVEGGAYSGFDDCAAGSTCMEVDEEYKGTCMEVPTLGTWGWTCDDRNKVPVILDEGVVGVCLMGCEPILQDCGEDKVCIPGFGPWDDFVCVLDASGDGGEMFDTCEFANVCDPGLVCVPPSAAVECDQNAQGCCVGLCETEELTECGGQYQECMPWSLWYPAGEGRPDFENIGICSLPF